MALLNAGYPATISWRLAEVPRRHLFRTYLLKRVLPLSNSIELPHSIRDLTWSAVSGMLNLGLIGDAGGVRVAERQFAHGNGHSAS